MVIMSQLDFSSLCHGLPFLRPSLLLSDLTISRMVGKWELRIGLASRILLWHSMGVAMCFGAFNMVGLFRDHREDLRAICIVRFE